MAIVMLTRKRSTGPGCVGKPITLGRYKVWSKSLGRYVVDQTLVDTSYAGFRKVTLDNVNAAWSLKRGRRSNPRWFRSSFSPDADDGNDFSSFEAYDWTCLRGVGHYEVSDGASITSYDGGFIPYFPTNYCTPATFASVGTSGQLSGEYGTATAQGPKAWNKFKPKLHVVDLGQFVGEIRSTLPMLQQTARVFSEQFLSAFGKSARHLKKMSKEMSGQWLNLQFGYVPFVTDLMKCLLTADTLNAKLTQCQRDNNQWIRRRGEVDSTMDNPTLVYEATSRGVAGYPVYVAPTEFANGLMNSGPGWGKDIRATVTYVEKYRTWFSGCFRYYVPTFDYPDGIVASVLNFGRMYGLRMTPSLVWELTPWSWLADWVGNVGDNIDNLDSQVNDQLVAKYAYIMKTLSGQLQIQAALRCGGIEIPGLSWSRGFVVKTRRHANQFGFTLEWPNFNAFQWSILAALGLSRFKIETGRR